MSVITKLQDLASVPKWCVPNLIYEVQSGSVSYGMKTADSDCDIVGVVINKREDFFPNEAGHIYGFGPPPNVFTTWQKHHIQQGDSEYDLTIYGIAKWFDLMSGCNPNMVELLWIPLHCVRVNSLISQHIRSNRKLFLNKKAKHTFIGYAYAQLKRTENKDKTGKRAELIAAHGFDTKFLSHTVRLALEAEQILTEQDLDLTRNAELLKAIRSGAWTEEEGREWFSKKEKYLEECYEKSTLPHNPDMDAIKALLLECIEMHYGSLDKAIRIENRAEQTLAKIKELLS